MLEEKEKSAEKRPVGRPRGKTRPCLIEQRLEMVTKLLEEAAYHIGEIKKDKGGIK